MREVFTSKV